MSNIFIARGYTDLTYATTLAGAVTSTATSFTIATPVPLPNLPFTAALDFNTSAVELVLVTAVNGTAWTVQRGWDTITPLPAVAHNAGSSVAVITRTAVSTLTLQGLATTCPPCTRPGR
jgi:hypothetical protein